METAEQSLARLVGALERLVDQEAIQAVAGDHVGILATQGRAAPIVRRLAELGHRATTPDTRARLARIADHQRPSRARPEPDFPASAEEGGARLPVARTGGGTAPGRQLIAGQPGNAGSAESAAD